jgi:hypothetical protein
LYVYHFHLMAMEVRAISKYGRLKSIGRLLGRGGPMTERSGGELKRKGRDPALVWTSLGFA